MIHKLVTPIEKIQEKYINEEKGILNKEGLEYLEKLYGNNEEFRDEIINFVRDKKAIELEVILDRRYKTNTLNMLRKEYRVCCVQR